ncbi:MFS transporter [Myxococcota bacterium]|nr:MFS transporter [Myxococcota bacterium]
MEKILHFLNEYRLLMQSSVRELWVVYFAKLMESLAYFTSMMVMVLYFSQHLGLNDVEAGKLFGYWSLGYGILIFLAGALCDVIGIKRSLLLGLLACVVGRFLFGVAPSFYVTVLFSLPLLALGMPLLIPIKSAAIKQYTTARSRGLAFAIFYALMNVGALVAGIALDQLTWIVRSMGGVPKGKIVMKGGHDVTPYVLRLWGYEFSSYQLVFLFGFVTTLLGLLAIVLFVRQGIYAEEDVEATQRDQKERKNPLRLLWASMSHKVFWMFMILIVLMSVIKLLFTHVHITMPKFMLREIGPMAAIGKTYSINGFMMMVLPPLIAVYTARFRTFSVLIVGGFISALSPFFLAIDAQHYAPIAKSLGIHPVYVPVILFYVMLSIGEALWGPKLYEYTAAIAPKGEESTYMAMSGLPWVLAKLPAGIFSGYLLAAYCPEEGPRNAAMMWLVIGLTTLSAPVLLVFLRRWIVPKESA